MKLVWTLGQITDPEEVKKIMQTNLKGELVETIILEIFHKRLREITGDKIGDTHG
jgi:hypothetical protein